MLLCIKSSYSLAPVLSGSDQEGYILSKIQRIRTPDDSFAAQRYHFFANYAELSQKKLYLCA
jgi:hypothetical protein